MNNINLIPLKEYLTLLERRPSGEYITYSIRQDDEGCLGFYFKTAQDRDRVIQYLLEHGVENIQPHGQMIWGTFPRTVNVDESLARGEWVWDDWA